MSSPFQKPYHCGEGSQGFINQNKISSAEKNAEINGREIYRVLLALPEEAAKTYTCLRAVLQKIKA